VTAPAADAADRPDKAGPDHSAGIMVALILPDTVADSLTVPDGLPADELHITLAYLGTVEDVEAPAEFLQTLLATVGAVADDHEPLDGVIGGVGRFTGGDESEGDPFYASVDMPGLDELRVDLIRALRDAGLEPSAAHGFTPHVTLAYVPKDSKAPLPRLEDPIGVNLDAVTVVYGDAHVEVALGDDEPRESDGAPDDSGTRTGPLTAEEIADPRTWGELYTLRTFGMKSAWDESLHPRSKGKFAPKNQNQSAGPQLPPDWLNRVLAGDSRFVKHKPPKKKKKNTAAEKAKKARIAAQRKARREAAQRSRDRAELQELTTRDQFDTATDRENIAENTRRQRANAAIEAAKDPKQKETLRAAEKQRRTTWTSQQQQRHAQERGRRRQYEIAKRARKAGVAGTTASNFAQTPARQPVAAAGG
jgi:2'-5' RNA ligase